MTWKMGLPGKVLLGFGFSTSRAFIWVGARLIWSPWCKIMTLFHNLKGIVQKWTLASILPTTVQTWNLTSARFQPRISRGSNTSASLPMALVLQFRVCETSAKVIRSPLKCPRKRQNKHDCDWCSPIHQTFEFSISFKHDGFWAPKSRRTYF